MSTQLPDNGKSKSLATAQRQMLHIHKWHAEQELENIWRISENKNLCQEIWFVYLVMFVNLIFISNIICIGHFISYDKETNNLARF